MPQRQPLEPGEWTLVAPVPLPGDGCRVGACRAVLTQGISPWALVTFGTHSSLLQGVLEIAGCLAVPLGGEAAPGALLWVWWLCKKGFSRLTTR